jgi:quercetin dioxygenase-like cupin family protein
MSRQIAVIFGLATLLTVPAARADEVPDALSVEWNVHHPSEKLDEDANIRMLRCTFEPGDKHLRHWHPAYSGCAVTGGRGEVVDSKGTREIDLKEGQCGVNPPVPWHEFTNIGVTTIQFIIVEKKYLPPGKPTQ